jgi:carboxypeptidase family protein
MTSRVHALFPRLAILVAVFAVLVIVVVVWGPWRSEPTAAQPLKKVHYRISGRVFDPTSKQWLAGVAVHIAHTSLKTTTDRAGHYALEGDFHPGTYTVCFSAPGRETTPEPVSISHPGFMGGSTGLARAGSQVVVPVICGF